MNWFARVAATLLGIAGIAGRPEGDQPSLGDPEVDWLRAAFGGQIQVPPNSQTRWYPRDVESALAAADAGWIGPAAQLMRASHSDGVLTGVMSTRTDGLVRLPKKFRGAREQIEALDVGGAQPRSVFDEMLPPAELALLARDGIELGIGVGELVQVDGRDFPRFVRLDPEFLVYRWVENRWYFRSVAGLLPITPGDGRWVLHIPGGVQSPWHNGLWRALGLAWIRKTHANLHKDNYESGLAHPARVAVSPQGAPEEHKQSWFRKVMAWGKNTVFGVPPGYDVRLLESNGRGYDCFVKTISDQNNEFQISIAGQTVTTDGGAGFQNSDIHKTIRADLIKATADGVAYTVNTQVLPQFIVARWGEAGLDEAAVVEYDVTPAKDQNLAATALVSTANAILQLRAALAGTELGVDVGAVCTRFGVPVTAAPTVMPAANENAGDQAKPNLSLVREAA